MTTLPNTTRLVLLCFALCLLCSIKAESQSVYFPPPPSMPPPSEQGILPPPAPPCINCYKGFAFPIRFSFGAHYNVHGLNTRGWATDSLRFDFIQFYRGPSSLIYYIGPSLLLSLLYESFSPYVTPRSSHYAGCFDESGVPTPLISM